MRNNLGFTAHVEMSSSQPGQNIFSPIEPTNMNKVELNEPTPHLCRISLCSVFSGGRRCFLGQPFCAALRQLTKKNTR